MLHEQNVTLRSYVEEEAISAEVPTKNCILYKGHKVEKCCILEWSI
jgi:hypothetical protein